MSKTISIEGMSCQHCVKTITSTLQGLEGVTSVAVSLEAKNAVVEGTASDAALKEAIEDIGFDVVGIA